MCVFFSVESLKMEIIGQNVSMSDDEDDLQLLRMAALQTLKKPVVVNNKINNLGSLPATGYHKFSTSPKHKRGRGFHSGPGRGGRNGQFNVRSLNPNLISITIEEEQPPEEIIQKSLEPPPKLVRPQDRYNGKSQEDIKNKEVTSKFSRYDNSDNSESDELSESEHSDVEVQCKLERSNSLEELMLELDFGITGEKPRLQKNKIKKRKIKYSESESTEKEEAKSNDETEPISVKLETIMPENAPIIENNISQDEIKFEAHLDVRRPTIEGNKSPNYKHRSRSPIYRKRTEVNGNRHHIKKFHNRDNFAPQNTQYVAPIPNYHSIPFNQPRLSYNNHHSFVAHAYPQIPPYPPPRPVSPLNLNAEVLSTITMAPLSPRSAAFVLQNREIVERRKKSPRRSFSRSPSPRFRHSKSPRRTPSPRRYPRSLSPKKLSPSRRTVRSPRRNSPPRPAARRISTEKKASPKPKNASPKAPVKDRLGHRQNKQEDVKRKRTPSPEISNKQVKSNYVENVMDPVLEARRRKFEDQGVTKEGVIRLKPKIDEEKNDNDEIQDEDTLDLNLTDTNMDDIFSDEESDDENEGRFKSSTTNNRNVSVLPFTQLVNGPKREIKNKPLEETCRDHNNLRYNRTDRDRRRNDRRRRTPPPKSDRLSDSKKVSARNRSNAKKEINEKLRVTSPIENKKIEIKIRNPAKYETSSNYDVITEDEANKKKTLRKVAVANENEDTTKGDKKIEDDDEVSRRNEGDLRAQLSRKRAERQHHKLPVAEDVQSRLIQNALEGAVFKKSKKAKRKEKETAPIDKLPIHLRLGHNDSSVYMDMKKKKSKTRSSEQV